MGRIGIFFASETGNTAEVARLMQRHFLPAGTADVHDLDLADAAQVDAYESLIVGTSSMGCGTMPSALEAFLPELDKVDLSGKTVALFGLGDQYGYPAEFCDALGLLYVELLRRNARLIGSWPTAGYAYEASQADLGDGSFCGLVLDQNNQPQLTEHRIANWIAAIRPDLLAGTTPITPQREGALHPLTPGNRRAA
jgi:flavodoxin I